MNNTELMLLTSYIRDHTAARGVDLWAVETNDEMTAAKWAELTGRSPSTVSRNVRRAIEQRDSKTDSEEDSDQ